MSSSNRMPLPVETGSSSKFRDVIHFCASDYMTEAGAVIIDRQSDRVLLVYDELRGLYTLPRTMINDHEQLLAPLAGGPARRRWCTPLATPAPRLKRVVPQSGLRCSRLPLPRLTKNYTIPPDKDWDKLQAKVGYIPHDLTTDPIYVSFSTYWYRGKDDVWPDGYQLITYWSCGFIDREQSQLEPADKSQQLQYMLVPLEEALAREELKEKDSVAHAALAMFQAIWMVGKDLLEKKQ